MRRPFTVLMVINTLGRGGAERSLAELLPHLASGGVRPLVACLDHAAAGLERQVIGEGFDVRILRAGRFATTPRDVRGLVTAIRDLRSIIRREDPDVVHMTLFSADIVGRLASAGTRAATLTSLVGNTYSPERLSDPNVTATKLAACRLIDGWTARRLNDHFHAVSHAVKASAQAALKIPGERITVIHRGRDPGRLGRPGRERRAAVRRRLGIESDAEVIVHIGKQEYRKDIATLLEATAPLACERPRLVLLQAGRAGHASDSLRDQAERVAPQDHVRLLGYREDVPELLAAADVFVFPSLYEGLGGSVIEAMALGLPVVAADTPAMREVLEPERNALLVPPEHPRDLAAAVARLLDDPARRRAFGERGRQIFDQRFTLRHSSERMLDLYQLVVDRRRRGKPRPRR